MKQEEIERLESIKAKFEKSNKYMLYTSLEDIEFLIKLIEKLSCQNNKFWNDFIKENEKLIEENENLIPRID